MWSRPLGGPKPLQTGMWEHPAEGGQEFALKGWSQYSRDRGERLSGRPWTEMQNGETCDENLRETMRAGRFKKNQEIRRDRSVGKALIFYAADSS